MDPENPQNTRPSPPRPPKQPIIKWLVLGFLGTMVVLAGFILILVWKFTPIVKVDEQTGQVAILGGLIHINQSPMKIRVRDQQQKNLKDISLNGAKTFDPSLKNIKVIFTNGTFVFQSGKANSVEWRCSGKGTYDKFDPASEGENAEFDFSEFDELHCEVGIPSKTHLEVSGFNGKINFKKPEYSVQATLSNGIVGIEPQSKQRYAYDMHVTNGHTDTFQSSKDPNALPIHVEISNGNIQLEE